jgi:hypothetical protein
LLLAVLGLVVSQDDFDMGDMGEEDFGDWGGYDDYDGYDDYGEDDDSSSTPGVLEADEFSLPKLLNTGVAVVVEFNQESWTSSSEAFTSVADHLKDRQDVLIVKVVTSDTDLVEKYSLDEEEDNQILIFNRGGEPILVEADDYEEAVGFVETMVDENVFQITSKVKGFTVKTGEEQAKIVQEVDSFISFEAKNPSNLAVKLAKFVKITSARWAGDIDKLEAEQNRLETLLDENSENISVEKVLEFRVRLQLLKAMQSIPE